MAPHGVVVDDDDDEACGFFACLFGRGAKKHKGAKEAKEDIVAKTEHRIKWRGVDAELNKLWLLKQIVEADKRQQLAVAEMEQIKRRLCQHKIAAAIAKWHQEKEKQRVAVLTNHQLRLHADIAKKNVIAEITKLQNQQRVADLETLIQRQRADHELAFVQQDESIADLKQQVADKSATVAKVKKVTEQQQEAIASLEQQLKTKDTKHAKLVQAIDKQRETAIARQEETIVELKKKVEDLQREATAGHARERQATIVAAEREREHEREREREREQQRTVIANLECKQSSLALEIVERQQVIEEQRAAAAKLKKNEKARRKAIRNELEATITDKAAEMAETIAALERTTVEQRGTISDLEQRLAAAISGQNEKELKELKTKELLDVAQDSHSVQTIDVEEKALESSDINEAKEGDTGSERPLKAPVKTGMLTEVDMVTETETKAEIEAPAEPKVEIKVEVDELSQAEPELSQAEPEAAADLSCKMQPPPESGMDFGSWAHSLSPAQRVYALARLHLAAMSLGRLLQYPDESAIFPAPMLTEHERNVIFKHHPDHELVDTLRIIGCTALWAPFCPASTRVIMPGVGEYFSVHWFDIDLQFRACCAALACSNDDQIAAMMHVAYHAEERMRIAAQHACHGLRCMPFPGQQ